MVFNQKRPDLNWQIYTQYTSGVTLRRIAQNLNCNYKTVFRKFLWLSAHAEKFISKKKLISKEIYIDESESIEHTKLKPLTIALAVNENYQILGVKVGRIPAKGLLAKVSVKKYGRREDESEKCIRSLLENIQLDNTDFIVRSDAKLSYQKLVKQIFPGIKHEVFVAKVNKEKRKEYKYTNQEKRIFDPLFRVNQRAAKFRDHIKRMTRKSWCTTKRIENLERQLNLYIARNNEYEFL